MWGNVDATSALEIGGDSQVRRIGCAYQVDENLLETTLVKPLVFSVCTDISRQARTIELLAFVPNNQGCPIGLPCNRTQGS